MAETYTLQNLRGTTSANNKYAGPAGVITVDTEKKSLRVHVGDKKTGGYEVAMFSQIPTKVSQLTNDKNYAIASGSDGNVIDTALKAVSDENGKNINSTYAKLAGATFTGNVHFSKASTGQTVSKTANDNNLATTKWVATASCVVHTTGDETIDGSKTFLKDIQGTAVRAYWADLAENYLSDAEYPHGTLICFGGEQEITIATEKTNGVVSLQPALLMNQKCKVGTPIALAGRVDLLVKGQVKKFDNIVLSDVAGVGVVDNEAPVELVIGKALQDKNEVKTGLVLCVTKFNLL